MSPFETLNFQNEMYIQKDFNAILITGKNHPPDHTWSGSSFSWQVPLGSLRLFADLFCSQLRWLAVWDNALELHVTTEIIKLQSSFRGWFLLKLQIKSNFSAKVMPYFVQYCQIRTIFIWFFCCRRRNSFTDYVCSKCADHSDRVLRDRWEHLAPVDHIDLKLKKKIYMTSLLHHLPVRWHVPCFLALRQKNRS